VSERVVVFAPTRPGDEALSCTRWMAEHTMAMLRSENIEPVPVLDQQATRTSLESSATGSVRGIALFSHGLDAHIGSSGSRARLAVRDDAILGADGTPALDRDNLHITRERWVHAIACYSGVELGAQAVHTGADCFVGYDCAVMVLWEPGYLPAEVEPLVRELVTITTRNLARGERNERTLLARAAEVAEMITAWCEEHNDWCIENRQHAGGLEAMTHQLVERMQVFAAARS